MMGRMAMTSRRAVLVLLAMVGALMLSSGVALAATITCLPDEDCFGTEDADTLEGSISDEYMFGRGGNDTLNGLGGNDELYGEEGNDNLLGGASADRLVGGPGRDMSNGDGGDDTYYFGPRWGKDVISDDSSSTNVLRFRKSYYEPVLVSQGLTIRLTPGTGPEVKNKLKTTTINWEGHAIDNVYSGVGNDKITGDALANRLDGGDGGKDTIFGEGGDDYINVGDGSGDDIVDCGEDLIGGAPDADEVHYDLGDDVSNNCETKVIAT